MRISPYLPLFMTSGLLLCGNGLIGTLVTLRGAEEGFSPLLIGLFGTAYFGGFMLACFYVPRLIYSVGHIRVFSAFSAVVAVCTILMAIHVEPFSWFLARMVMGFCISGLFTAAESWLNEMTGNSDRAQVLSIYRLVDLSAVTAGQFVIPVFDLTSDILFLIPAMLFCLCLVPITLSPKANPTLPEKFPFDLKAIWIISPLACVGSFAIGVTNSAFRIVGPLYGSAIGLDVVGVASFMSAGIIGGAVLQYPLGWMSDHLGRRNAILTGTFGAVGAGLFLSFFGDLHFYIPYVGAFLFGAFALPLYSLSAALANDNAGRGRFVITAAGLTFFFSMGATVGPLIAAGVVDFYGPSFLFVYTSLIHGSLIAFTIFRILSRPEQPVHLRTRFVSMLRTSPAFFGLVRKERRKKGA